DPGWEGERLIWPPYLPGADPADPEGALPAGTPDARAGRQLRAQYGAMRVRPTGRPPETARSW
ncbi:MAG: hypothetical protein ACXWJO_06120, partial [Xanthobacteraceae bacterium]